MPKFGSAIDTLRIPIKGLIAEASGTAPADPGTGQQWTDTGAAPAPVLKVWTGTSWVRADGADLPDGTITDAKIAAGAGISISKLATNPLARANHTGTQPASSISDFDTAVRANRLDQLAAPTAAVNVNGQQVINGADPTLSHHLTTKSYVDALVDNARSGIAGVKDPVRVAAQGNVNLASPGASIDGVALSTGDRFLAPAQTTTTENGIYEWNGAASPATRAPDADAAGEIRDGTILAVAEGTDAGRQYIQTASGSGAPGSWTQTWTVYNTAGSTYLAGNGLQLAGNTFSVLPADGSITVSGSGVTVGNVPVAKGGTGATTAAQARTNLAALTAYSTDSPALTAGVAANIVHNLGTEDVTVYVRETSGGKGRIYLDESVVDGNTISLRADLAYSAGALRVTVTARA